MKRIILALMVCTMLAGCAGFHAMTPEEMQIQKVVEVPNTPKSILFDKSRMWYATAFRSANSVIQYENKENGTIMGNGNVSDSVMMVLYTLRFSVATEVKDNKARITATGQSLYTTKGGEIAVNRRMWDNMKGQIEEVMDGYEKYLKSSVASIKTDKW